MTEYISREDVLRKFIEGDGHDDDRFTEGYNFAVQEYREKVKKIPSADVQPIRHGRWLSSDACITIDCQVCSECRSNILMDRFYYDYCPVCGARMDGDTNG